MLVSAFLTVSLTVSAEVSREHRAIWLSSSLSASWPSAKLNTETIAKGQQGALRGQLEKLKNQNINVIYFHVRVNCDALYESSYEPWSSYVSGTRGTAPYFDPFKFLIDEAHARGIEVYAWLNPYRYHADKGGSWGSDERNYEVSHPEWLIDGDTKNRVLNPALEEVKQRIVDVCKEVVTKYDVDGIIFDDYFYPQGGTTETESAPDYAQYKASGSSLSIGDWRRANVNDMIRRVGEMIEETKPYVRFGVSPAAVACPSNSETEYGLPYISGDWQYNTIYSDPLNWMKNGYIDYISPQVYAPTFNFETLSKWWGNASKTLGRHLYLSAGLDQIATLKSTEFIQETLLSRDACIENTAGMVYFDWGKFVNYYESRVLLGEILKDAVNQTKVLAPICPWSNERNPVMTSNVTLDGTTLSWTEVPGMRYTIYAVPENITDAEFCCQREYLEAVSYTNSYTIPSDKTSGYRWAVAVYDRYGNEYAPLFVGGTPKTINAATLVSPANGGKALALSDYKWESSVAGAKFTVEFAEDADFNKCIGIYETHEKSLSSSKLPALTIGKTYYWRVITASANALDVVSDVHSFVGSNVDIISPAQSETNVSITPTITWNAADAGSKYLVEVSIYSDMLSPIYSLETTETSYTIPGLSSYRNYYVRVTATKDGNSMQSAIVGFKTKDMTYTDAPKILNPESNGVTLYSNDKIKVSPWNGFIRVIVEVSSSQTFPVRNKIVKYLSGFSCETEELSTLNLKNGTTYYVRALGAYNTASSMAEETTDPSEVMTFVYNSEVGIESVGDDTEAVYIANDVLVLNSAVSQVDIYTVSGQHVASIEATDDCDLSYLPSGAYVIKVANSTGVTTIKHIK